MLDSKQHISNYGYCLNESSIKTMLIAPFLNFSKPTPSGYVFTPQSLEKENPVPNRDVTFHFNPDNVVGRLVSVMTNEVEAIATIDLNTSKIAQKILESPDSYQLAFSHNKENILGITFMVMGDLLAY